MSNGAPATEYRRAIANRRGMSAVTSLILMVAVLALVAVGTYAALGGFTKSTGPLCSPPNSPICGGATNPHDLTLLIPFRSIQQGATVPFTASAPAGETLSGFTFYWGDGKSLNSSAATVSHNYTSPGTYLVEVTANVGGQLHDNIQALQQVVVTPAASASTAGAIPTILGRIVSNSTTPATSHGATAVLPAGGSVTLTGSYTANPTNPSYFPNAPSIVITHGGAGAAVSGANGTTDSYTETLTFAASGTTTVTFVGSATDHTTNITVFQNYSWTVLVPPVGVRAGIANHDIVKSPHPGTFINYILAPGGALSEDPAIDYETVGYEPILNVYQTLITYNGSQTGPTYSSFVPELATCVPGSPECQSLYGNTMIHGWNYTFVIQHNASFYDPNTKASWGVYPSDVVFSVARTLGFSTLPCVGCNNGWILGQSLLDPGNGIWNVLHGPYNNTPQNILGSMSVNDSYCPPSATTTDHGCVTFHAYGAHHPWPYFLELIADALGGAIVPCGWFSAPSQGAGIPYWTAGNVSGAGDHPCGLPGSPGFGVPASAMPFTGWDRWEQVGSGSFGYYLGHVQYSMVGSGPYYLSQYSVGTSYTLQASPGYGQNPYCTWLECQPAASNYARTVEVTWETQATEGEQAYVSGVADHASIPSTDIALLLQMISAGKVGALSAPTLTIGFFPFNMNFNLGGAQRFTTTSITVPGDWFSYMGMRQFFARAYQYTTIENTINTRNGIQLGFLYGGAIPQFMANYYPKDIPWPTSDPCTDAANPVCPTYWWQQMQTPSSPYYDPEATKCTTANPCQLPLFGSTGSPSLDQEMALWANQVSILTSGAVKMTPVDIDFVSLLVNSEFSGPGQNPMPFYSLGWAPDYPDPTDYVVPLYYPNGTYTFGDSVMQSLLVPAFSTGCGHPVSDYNYFANNSFGNNCQGVAYKAMINALGVAAVTPAGPYRVLVYDLAEHIAEQLGLYVYTSQANQVSSFASWIDSSSINTNVTIGGGGDWPYFWITGNGVQYDGST